MVASETLHTSIHAYKLELVLHNLRKGEVINPQCTCRVYFTVAVLCVYVISFLPPQTSRPPKYWYKNSPQHRNTFYKAYYFAKNAYFR